MGSEYGGTGPRPQMVQPKGHGALTAPEKVILLNTTGSTDPLAPTDDKRTWQGLNSDSQFGEPVNYSSAVPDPFDDTQ